MYTVRSYCNIPMIRICEIDSGNPKTRNSRNWFRYETFYCLWVKGYSTWGEKDTIFLCWLLLHRKLSTQPTRGARSAQSRLASPSTESRLSRSEAGTQLTTFSQIPKSSAHASGHDVIHLASLDSYLGFLFWHLWMTHPLYTRVNTCVNVAPN